MNAEHTRAPAKTGIESAVSTNKTQVWNVTNDIPTAQLATAIEVTTVFVENGLT